MTTIDVLVCTYKRPELLAITLNGIAQAIPAGYQVRIIVVDNDVECSAQALLQRQISTPELEYIYLSQPVQNISLTRNAALAAAGADYIALIDDDEVPVKNWLGDMIAAAETYHADVVFAPVVPQYEEGVPDWVRRGGFFDFRTRHATGARIPTLEMRTGNVLLKGSIIERTAARFDPALGLSGGEDVDFFKRLDALGMVSVWADEAVVHEAVPVARANIRWFLMRAFRVGSVNSFRQRREESWSKILVGLGKAVLFIGHGGLMAMMWSVFCKHKCVKAMQRIAMGFGIFYGLVFGPYSEYRAAANSGEK